MLVPASEIRRIVIFRALQLGDMLCAIPAIRALRHAYPEAEISLLGLPWAQSLLQRFPHYFDQFIRFPGYPGLPEQPFDPKTFPAFLMAMQHQSFDLALQMQGNGSIVNPMMALLGARHTAGFCLPQDYAPEPPLFLQYPDGVHEVERHLLLMQHLGIGPLSTAMEFPLYGHDQADLDALGMRLKAGSYVVVHPGSRGAWRQWPPAYFAALADRCAACGLQVILTGTQTEQELVDAVRRHMKGPAVSLAGKTSLGAMGILIRDARLLISNCTGVSHIAAALQTPSVVISMDGEPHRWGPLNKSLHNTIDWTQNPGFEVAMRALDELLERAFCSEQFGNRGSLAR
jgi:ADP-heptose:LPS heptosyltransferase